MDKTVIIIGSSRKNGNTSKIVDSIANNFSIDVLNLSDYNFSYFDYESKNLNDDFLPLIKTIIQKYQTIVFATPIYWYNMSGVMKVFFDRFSDLLTVERDLGRQLRGKNFSVISNSGDDEYKIEETFYIPFIKTADYLGMNYIGNIHFNVQKTINTKSFIKITR